METSQNGWSASPKLKTRPLVVAGESFSPGIRDNADVYTVLKYVAEQMHARVEPIVRADWHQADDWGFYYRANRNDPTALSNHSSGTAIDYNATRHPNGVATAKTFSAKQIAEVHEILDEVDHVVRWGGDYTRTVDSMHFEINANAAAVAKVAARLREPVTPPKAAMPKPKTSPGKWASFLHIAPYWVNDSVRAVRKAASRKDKAIDLNFHLTADMVWVNTHWSNPLQHGFKWDKSATATMRSMPKSTPIHEMTWKQVQHLVSIAPGQYRINRARHILGLAHDLGVRVEFEDKGGGGRRAQAYRGLMKLDDVKEMSEVGRFQVKTLTQIPGAAGRLRAAKAAGFTTIVSTTNAKSKRLSLQAYGPVADYVRGSVTWVS